jgi:hypothetical protein
VFLLVWVGLFWFVSSARVSDKAEIDEFSSIQGNESGAWEREDLYRLAQNDIRRESILRLPQLPDPEPLNKDRIKILVMGDSYTVGWGITNEDSIWWKRLEYILNDSTTKGTFEVSTIARGGASLYTYADWAGFLGKKDYSPFLGDSDLSPDKLSGFFDVVIIGFVDNDMIANYDDLYIKESDRPRPGSLDELSIITGKSPNPHQKYFDSIPSYIINTLQPTMALWQPLTEKSLSTAAGFQSSDLFQKSGWVLGKNDSAEKLSKNYEYKDLTVSQVDAHPGPALHYSFAKDTAETILKNINPSRLERAVRGAKNTNHLPINLLSNFLPAQMEVEQEDSSSSVYFKGSATLKYCRNVVSGSNRGIRCKSTGSMEFYTNKETYPPQMVGCLPLGRPYAQVSFNTALDKNTVLEVSIKTKEDLELWGFYYNSEGFEISERIGHVSSSPLNVPLEKYNGLYVASTKKGCNISPKEPSLGEFTLTLFTKTGP